MIDNESCMDPMRDAMTMMRHDSGYTDSQSRLSHPAPSSSFDRHGEREFHHRRHVIFDAFLVHQQPLASMISSVHVILTDLL